MFSLSTVPGLLRPVWQSFAYLRRRFRTVRAFFRLPSEEDKEVLRALHREENELLLVCEERLQEIVRLHREAEQLLEAINAQAGVNPPAARAE
jgi:hypothetical protein